MHGPSESHLADDPGESDEGYKDQVGNQKGGPSEFPDPVGEHPDIGHAHRTPDTGNHKAEFIIKFILRYRFHFTHFAAAFQFSYRYTTVSESSLRCPWAGSGPAPSAA